MRAGKHTFLKAARLKRHADFERVYRQGRRQVWRNLTVFSLRRPGEPESPPGFEAEGGCARGPVIGQEESVPGSVPGKDALAPRVGLTVGRALGTAVERNRIKRRLREALRRQAGQAPAAMDIVINPKKSVLQMKFALLESEVQQALAALARAGAERRGKA